MSVILKSHPSGKSDLIGMVSALLCAVHCLAMPILIGISATLTWVHEMTFVFLIIGGIAAYSSTKNAHMWVKLLIWPAFALLTISAILEHGFNVHTWLNYWAAAILIVGHGVNWRFSCRAS